MGKTQDSVPENGTNEAAPQEQVTIGGPEHQPTTQGVGGQFIEIGGGVRVPAPVTSN